jgi:hypothetical protein
VHGNQDRMYANEHLGRRPQHACGRVPPSMTSAPTVRPRYAGRHVSQATAAVHPSAPGASSEYRASGHARAALDVHRGLFISDVSKDACNVHSAHLQDSSVGSSS